jgi:hypothetical protein
LVTEALLSCEWILIGTPCLINPWHPNHLVALSARIIYSATTGPGLAQSWPGWANPASQCHPPGLGQWSGVVGWDLSLSSSKPPDITMDRDRGVTSFRGTFIFAW